MAKSAAKNINSLASQTIVPTATTLGRLTLGGVRTVLLMGVIIPENPVFPMAIGPFGEVVAVKLITHLSRHLPPGKGNQSRYFD
jgi:hypothetical protein